MEEQKGDSSECVDWAGWRAACVCWWECVVKHGDGGGGGGLRFAVPAECEI